MNKAIKKKWEVISKSKTSRKGSLSIEDIVSTLLANRGIKTRSQKERFFNPPTMEDISLKDAKIKRSGVEKTIKRIRRAKKNKEKVIIYGDYDADGVCATAILWECLYSLGIDVEPYIPDRFSDGYGLNAKSVEKIKLKSKGLKLIITVDNGIVAFDGVEKAKELGIEIIITDHHEPEEKYPKAHSIIHSQEIGGAGIAWFVSREIQKKLKTQKSLQAGGQAHTKCRESLELAAIGTVSDQIPLIGVNRSIVKYGLDQLNNTTRVGLLEVYKEAGLRDDLTHNFSRNASRKIGTYEIGFIIAPRINAMGRLEHAIDSLRLLCTKSKTRARKLANYLSETNRRRQEIVFKVLEHARKSVKDGKRKGVIVIAHETYHEGVVGLAASRLVDEFYRPAIVFSTLGKISKASARSISGFNIIEALRKLDDMLLAAGGHPMAAGVTVTTKDLKKFEREINKVAAKKLNEDILSPKLKIDIEVDFKPLEWELISELNRFTPTGSGNSNPLFTTKGVTVWNAKTVGKEARHIKMKVMKNNKTFDAIGFGLGYRLPEITEGQTIDIAYYFEENDFNGVKSMQLRIKDIKLRK